MDHRNTAGGATRTDRARTDRASDVRLVCVDTDKGKLLGLRSNGAVSFRGIPYAAPTGGANRFRAPQPVEGWSDLRPAFQFGNRCPQPLDASRARVRCFDWYDNKGTGMGEDCCVLNVYSPDLDRSARRPVMVFFHGGGFARGGGDGPVLDGVNLASFGDVVVVTLNHRLNFLGLLNLGFLDPDFADAGNAGMLDILAALHWINRNIEGFGGDPGNVTVFGQSGGGAKVLTVLGMPAAKDLVHRGIDMSGASSLGMPTAEAREPLTLELLKQLGLGRGDVRKLQQLPFAQVHAAHQAAVRAIGTYVDYRPVIDGVHLLADASAPQTLARHSGKQLMIGTTSTETSWWMGSNPKNTGIGEAELLARFQAQFGLDPAGARALAEAYRVDDPGRSAYGVLARVSTDAVFRGRLLDYGALKARASEASVYFYDFAWQVPVDGGVWMSPHTADIPFVFGTLCTAESMTGGDASPEALSSTMMAAFTAFARSGDPNHADLPAWAPHDGESRATMVFGDSCKLVHDHMSAERIANAALPRQESLQLMSGPLFQGVKGAA